MLVLDPPPLLSLRNVLQLTTGLVHRSVYPMTTHRTGDKRFIEDMVCHVILWADLWSPTEQPLTCMECIADGA